jgi:hypothetical protein
MRRLLPTGVSQLAALGQRAPTAETHPGLNRVLARSREPARGDLGTRSGSGFIQAPGPWRVRQRVRVTGQPGPPRSHTRARALGAAGGRPGFGSGRTPLVAFVANRCSAKAGGGRGASCSLAVLGSHVDWQKSAGTASVTGRVRQCEGASISARSGPFTRARLVLRFGDAAPPSVARHGGRRGSRRVRGRLVRPGTGEERRGRAWRGG